MNHLIHLLDTESVATASASASAANPNSATGILMKKKEKEAADMRNALQIGDTVTTIGGITGIVNSIHDDEFVMETTTDRTKMCFKRWAIQEVKKLEL